MAVPPHAVPPHGVPAHGVPAGDGSPDGVPDHDAAVYRGRPVEPVEPVDSAERLRSARIAVVGAGAVGAYVAARAGQAGAEVVLCVRRGGYDRVRVLRSASAGGTFETPLRVITNPAELDQPLDWVVLATKAHQTPAAMDWLHAALALGAPATEATGRTAAAELTAAELTAAGPEAAGPAVRVGSGPGVVVAQNGVRQDERVSPPVPRGSVLPAVVYINAEAPEPGVVRHLAYGVLQIPDSPLGERFARVLPTGDVRLVDDFATAAWSKLLANSAANSVTALTGRGLEVLRRPDVAELALAVMRETAAVGRTDGARIRADAPERTLERLHHQPAGAGTSMLRDRLAGRPLEHEALIGTVVRLGQRAGVATPVCATLLPLLAAVNQGGAGADG